MREIAGRCTVNPRKKGGSAFADVLVKPGAGHGPDPVRRAPADAQGLGGLLMAQAGYHPDFVIAVQRRFRALLGDQTRFDEFFATHPRWAAREEHTMRAQPCDRSSA